MVVGLDSLPGDSGGASSGIGSREGRGAGAGGVGTGAFFFFFPFHFLLLFSRLLAFAAAWLAAFASTHSALSAFCAATASTSWYLDLRRPSS